MDKVRIVKGGKLVGFGWDKKVKAEVEQAVDGLLLDYLMLPCEIEAGVKLRDILMLLDQDASLYTQLLTNGPWLKDIVSEGLNNPFKSDDDKVEWLELRRFMEAEQYEPAKCELEDHIQFHGIGEGGPYALDFSPIYTMTELEVRLNEEIDLYDQRQHTPTPPILLHTTQGFTLLDILHGIFWDLSFHGSPENRDARKQEIVGRVKEIEDGTVKTIPWEDIKAEWEEKNGK